MSCIHQKIDDIYHDSYCELNNAPCDGNHGCPNRTSSEATYNSTTNKFETAENGVIKEVENKPNNTEMTMPKVFEVCGGKANWAKYYSAFDDCLANFIERVKLDHSEHSWEIMKTIADEVIEDYRESWYRRSLGKGYGV